MDAFTTEAMAQDTEAEAPVTPVVAVPAKESEQPAQPQGKTYTQAEYEAALLKERQVISKHTSRIKELEGKVQLSAQQTQELTSLKQSITGLEDMVALLLDAQGATAPEAPTTHLQRLQQQRAQQTQRSQQAQLPPEILAEHAQLNRLVKKAKLSADSEELRAAQAAYSTEGFDAAVEYLEGIVGKGKDSPEDMKARIKAEILKDLGVNPDSVDSAVPSGAGSKHVYTAAELEDRGFVRKHWKDISAAQNEGRIKE